MSAIIDSYGNDAGSPSMSKNDDNLSNSDGPLIRRCIQQNSCNNIQSSMSSSDEASTKKRYCFWVLTFVLAIIGICNLLLNITVLTVLRIGQGMESIEVIPDENLVKFYGRTDLDRVCLHSGVSQSYGDEPLEVSGDDAGIEIDVKSRRNPERSRSKLQILSNGTSFSQIKSFEIRDPRTGAVYFSTDIPNFGLPAGVEKINVKIAETHRITSPVNESLTINSDDQISMHGAEGARMDSKDIAWSADGDVYLQSINGSIIFDGKDGAMIDVDNIPVAPLFLPNAGHEQYKVCVCMPQGKLFRLPIRSGANVRSANCARVSRTPENDPCLR